MNRNCSCRKTSIRRPALALALSLLAAPLALAQGTDVTWIAPGGGTFAEATNWDLGIVPGRFDRSIFNLSEVYSVTLDQDAQNQYVLINAGQVTFDLGGFTFRNYVKGSGGSDRRLIVGDVSGDHAEFAITGGTWESVGDFILGHEAGSFGHLIVTGPTTAITGFEGGPSNDRIRVGQFGDGMISVLDGARVEQDLIIGGENGAVGHALISGPGTHYNGGSVVGYASEGYIEISNGASVNAIYDLLSIGQNAGSYGEALITGPGTTYVGDIRVGWEGEGHLTIANGVSMAGSLYVSDRGIGAGTAHVSGPDTFLDLDRIQVGNADAQGNLVVDLGTQIVLNGDIRVAGPAGFMQIADPGTYVSSQGILLGGFGSGNQLIVSNGAAVEVPNNGTTVDAASLLITDPDTTYVDTSFTGIRVYGTVSSGEGMTIANGAAVQATRLWINGDPGASVELSGEGSSLTVIGLDEKHIGTAYIGDVGYGTLVVGEGASVCIEELVVGDGGTIEGEVTVGECGAGLSGLGINAKTLDVAGQALLSDTHIDVLSGGTLTGDGVVLADVLNQGGRIAPGGQSETLTVLGDYDQQSLAGMSFQVRGRYPGEYDHLDVVGVASLDGELVCDPFEDVSLANGNQFVPLTATEVHGTFRSARMTRPEGQRAVVSYEADRVVVTIAQGLTLNSSQLYKGQDANMSVTNSRPNTPTFLIYSTTGLDDTYIPQLDVRCGLKRPTLAAGPLRTNSQGQATFTVRVPSIGSNPRVYLQAVQTHDASNIVDRRVRD